MKSTYNIYTLLKIYKRIKSRRLKLLGLLITSTLGFRHLSIRIDPALTCNLFCTMCYFSNADTRKKMKGRLSIDEMRAIARIFFSKAFQVVVGCGAEPTVNNDFMELIKLAVHYKVPNISIVTNGQLLRDNHIQQMIQLNIDELILSAHGLTKKNYEKFMVNGKFETFINLLKTMKNNKSAMKLRINYTVNDHNLEDLSLLPQFIENYPISTIQVRPIMDIGGKYSTMMSKDSQINYLSIINEVKASCLNHGVTLLANTSDVDYQNTNNDSALIESVYTYISPNTSKQLELDFTNTTLQKYKHSVHWNKKIIKAFISKNEKEDINLSRSLKYDIQ